MDKDERQKMMRSMMEQFFAGKDVDETKELFATMMNGMCAGIDMKEMMMGMTSGGEGPGKMQDTKAKMMQGARTARTSSYPDARNDDDGHDAPLQLYDAACHRQGRAC